MPGQQEAVNASWLALEQAGGDTRAFGGAAWPSYCTELKHCSGTLLPLPNIFLDHNALVPPLISVTWLNNTHTHTDTNTHTRSHTHTHIHTWLQGSLGQYVETRDIFTPRVSPRSQKEMESLPDFLLKLSNLLPSTLSR